MRTTTRGPLDLRLMRRSAAARRYVAIIVALTTVSAVAIVLSAVCIGTVLGGVITGDSGDWPVGLAVLIGALMVDGVCTWIRERFGHRAADSIVTDLELDVLSRSAEGSVRDHDAFVLVTRSLTDLRVYLAEYVPALGTALTVPPIVLAVIAWFDLTSALIIIVTIPFVPIFMILIGVLSKDRAAATLTSLTRQSAEMLDVLEGLPTLRALGRERGLDARLRRTGERYRKSALAALRIAFLSSFVLEFIATLSVALVAVSIGLRLVFGEMPLTAGIIALVLAPQVYSPIRNVGAKFHAAEDGVAAMHRASEILDRTPRPAFVRGGAGTSIVLDRVSVPARNGFAPFDLSATMDEGQITVLTGPNGCGKSTTLRAILGLADSVDGNVTVSGLSDDWWQRVAWLPQNPAVIPGTLRENLALSGIARVDASVLDACAATGFDDVLATLPHGWDTQIGVQGEGLSRGQRQRFALTRVLASPREVLLLDEPTAHLDEAAERRVLVSLGDRAARGATVVLVAHRPTLIAAADKIVEVHAADI